MRATIERLRPCRPSTLQETAAWPVRRSVRDAKTRRHRIWAMRILWTAASAPLPTADVHRATVTSAFVPAPDMISLLDHLVGSVQHRCRDFEAKRFGGPEIDHQLECGRLLNWYIA